MTDQIANRYKPDSHFMEIALKEAHLSLAESHIPVGAVIVFDNQIRAKGRNRVLEVKSDLAHAEMQAMLSAQQILFEHKGECTLYTTMEPCMMCLGAMINIQIGRLVIAKSHSGIGAVGLAESLFYYRSRLPKVDRGIMEQKSHELIVEYVKRTGQRQDLLGM